jgi:hypothetical protein
MRSTRGLVRRSAKREGGFTMVELLIATGLTLLVTAVLVGLVDPARGVFRAQPEISDMHQRLRVAVDALTRDLQMAGAGIAPGASPPVAPYRIGALGSDADAGVFYRAGVLSVTYVSSSAAAVESRTYYLRPDPATRALHLMRYDGIQTDLPLVDHLLGLDVAYFDESDTPLDPAVLQDGPWLPSDPDIGVFDEDLLRIRRVRVVLRVGGGRYAPDSELQFDVALRNAAAAAW